MGGWDYAMIAAVTLQGSLLAYLHAPRWKAVVLLIPVPFTMAALAVGRPVDATNVWGVALLYCFTHAVRLLHYRLRAPIIPAIVAAALGYCLLGAAAARLLPEGDAFFWLSVLLVAGLAGAALAAFPQPEEPGGRTELPPWIKLPAIAAVVLGLVLVKNWLQGFATAFPMLGVIAAYEARNCLGTVCRAIPLAMVILLLLIVPARLAEGHLGLPAGLAIGWAALAVAIWPLCRAFLFRPRT